MSSPSDDDADSELSKYAPKWARERPATPNAERPRLVNTASTVPRSAPAVRPPAVVVAPGRLRFARDCFNCNECAEVLNGHRLISSLCPRISLGLALLLPFNRAMILRG
jgi:hypothetical protein